MKTPTPILFLTLSPEQLKQIPKQVKIDNIRAARADALAALTDPCIYNNARLFNETEEFIELCNNQLLTLDYIHPYKEPTR